MKFLLTVQKNEILISRKKNLLKKDYFRKIFLKFGNVYLSRGQDNFFNEIS